MFNIEEMKREAANGNTTAMWRLSMMHLEGMLPDAQEGIRLLERLSAEPYNRHGARLELGLRYYNGSHVSKDTAKGLEMIEQAVLAQGDDVSTEHCYEAGMIFASVTGSNGEKVEKYQRLSKRLLEKVFADTKWVDNFVKISPDGDQAVLLLKHLLESVNGWLDATDNSKKTVAEATAVPVPQPQTPPMYSTTESPSETRFCTNCGYRFDRATINFCPKCGTKKT